MNVKNLYNKALSKLIKKEDLINKFFKLLDVKIDEAKEMLDERFDWQCSQSYKSAKFMYENNTMYGYIPEEGIKSALKHGTTVIGHIGDAETLNILIDKDHTNILDINDLNQDEVAANMIKNLEKTESRKLLDEEKAQIKEYVMNAYNSKEI